MPIFTGDEFDNVIDGTQFADVIYGDRGFDTLRGLGGSDIIQGNEDPDMVYGDAGDDDLDGGSGEDNIYGGIGNDTIEGGLGGDLIYGDAGNDTIRGGSSFEDDASSIDAIFGGAGDDVLTGGDGLLYAGVDTIIDGGDGNDTILSFSNLDFLDGGADDDRFVIYAFMPNSVTTILGSSGVDTVDFHLTSSVTGTMALFQGTGLVTENTGIFHKRDVRFSDDEIENFIGSPFADLVDGNDAANMMTGGGGNDVLSGGLGNDRMVNDQGADRLYGDFPAAILSDAETGIAGDPIKSLRVLATEASEGDTARISVSLDLFTYAAIPGSNGVSSFTLKVLVGGQQVQFISGGATVSTAGGEFSHSDTTQSYVSQYQYDLIVLGLDPNADDVVSVVADGTGFHPLSGIFVQSQQTAAVEFFDFNYAGGNDTFDGGAPGTGAGTFIGGLGDDTYIIRDTADVILENGAEGNDTVQTDIAGYVLPFAVENLQILGTAALDVSGNAFANVLNGNIGANVLDGREGADIMRGNGGGDTYFVDNVLDKIVEVFDAPVDLAITRVSYVLGANVEQLRLAAGAGNINGTGNTLSNTILGNESNNVLNGGLGNDTMAGGLGSDTYYVVETNDLVQEVNDIFGLDTVFSTRNYVLTNYVENLTLMGAATAGTGNAWGNALRGNSLANTLFGWAGNDFLDGGAGVDTLDGGAGNDVLAGGAGIDFFAGGAGNDTYIVDNVAELITETTGVDTIQTAFSFSLEGYALVENLTLTGGGSLSGTGNALNNVITGNDGSNILSGGDGNDTISGGLGNDRILGDGGNDRLFGGQGNDILDGGLGVDRLEGGFGNDIYRLEALDVVVETDFFGGTDMVESQVTYSLGAFLENLRLMGSASINGTGNEYANMITGNSGDNRLDGKAGPDVMAGGAGNDTYIVDGGGDIVIETASAGTDTVQSSIDFVLGANVENLTLTGGALFGTGNALANRIIGTSGANVLDGKLGADILTGGAGADSFVFSNLQNLADTITDFRPGVDKIQISAMAFGGGLMSGLPVQFTAVAGAMPPPVGTNGQFLYNTTTDELFFDRNGSGAGSLFLIAIVQTGSLALTANDFEVIAP
jgi:trimeric autotransporter adhesin